MMEGNIRDGLPDISKSLIDAKWNSKEKRIELKLDRSDFPGVNNVINLGGKCYKVEHLIEDDIDKTYVEISVRGLQFEMRHLHTLIK